MAPVVRVYSVSPSASVRVPTVPVTVTSTSGALSALLPCPAWATSAGRRSPRARRSGRRRGGGRGGGGGRRGGRCRLGVAVGSRSGSGRRRPGSPSAFRSRPATRWIGRERRQRDERRSARPGPGGRGSRERGRSTVGTWAEDTPTSLARRLANAAVVPPGTTIHASRTGRPPSGCRCRRRGGPASSCRRRP